MELPLLHETLNLYVSDDTYVFEPATVQPGLMFSEKAERETLTIERGTGKLVLNARETGAPNVREKVITCYSIIGLVKLATSEFLLIITGRTPSCRLLSHPIYLATDYRLLPINKHVTTASILEHPVESELVKLVEQGLRGGKLWFSYGWDLTNSLQRQHEQAAGGYKGGRAMWQRADDRFFWNRYLMERMIEQTELGGPENDLSRFILPIMYGSLELRSATINNRDLLFCLTSRRSRYRAGTRYFTRGIDQEGHTANYNETEQIILLDPLDEKTSMYGSAGRVEGRERMSYVQTRGSVPLFWAEINNLRYKPDLQIKDIPGTSAALAKHIDEQKAIYEEVWLVNLVNQKGYELPVKEAFEKAMQAIPDPKAHYVYFDFHHECRKLRFDRIQVLVDLLLPDIEKMGYFRVAMSGSIEKPPTEKSEHSPTPLKRQRGVIRSNCMDCLDRTNVAQSAIAKDVLQRQLRDAGILSYKERIDEHDDFMHIFRNVWADHADMVSKAYSGTGALKTDFTRTGKRTWEGAVQDGANSLTRYVKNNYFDGPRQDALDLLTGRWKATPAIVPQIFDERSFVLRWMPYVLAFALAMITACVLLPHPAGFSARKWCLWWGVLALLSFGYIWANGVQYVAWPRLMRAEKNQDIEYQGAGAHSKQRGRGTLAPDEVLGPLLKVINGILAMLTRKTKSAKRSKPDELEMGARQRQTKGALVD